MKDNQINYTYITKLKSGKVQLYEMIKDSIKINNPEGLWHTLNHYILEVLNKTIYIYNSEINDFTFKSIICFLTTMYEYDSFVKLLIAVGLPYQIKDQLKFYQKLNVSFILKWIPGMFLSRYVMTRDFIRHSKAKSELVNFNIKYMKTTINKLYALPDILILNTLNGVGAIVAEEAVDSKVFTIGLASSESFPHKISYRLFYDIENFDFIKSFIYMILYIIKRGSILFYKKNFNKIDTESKVFTKNSISAIKDRLWIKDISEIKFSFTFTWKEYIINGVFKKTKKKKKKI
jgi:hypothetical protein